MPVLLILMLLFQCKLFSLAKANNKYLFGGFPDYLSANDKCSISNNIPNFQEAKAINAELVAEKNSILEKMAMKEKELVKAWERFSAMDRRLTKESQEVSSLKLQLEALEGLKEQELLSIDGDTWLRLMYHKDQNLLDSFQSSLSEMVCYVFSILHTQYYTMCHGQNWHIVIIFKILFIILKYKATIPNLGKHGRVSSGLCGFHFYLILY